MPLETAARQQARYSRMRLYGPKSPAEASIISVTKPAKWSRKPPMAPEWPSSLGTFSTPSQAAWSSEQSSRRSAISR
jgi:hypothetical protein